MGLSLLSHDPADEQVVSPDTNIELKFSSELKLDTVNSKNVKLFDNLGPISYDRDFDNNSKTLILTPLRNLSRDGSIVVVINSELTDINGDQLDYNYTFEFYIEGRDKLETPEIIYPKNLASVYKLKAGIRAVDQAESYYIEVTEVKEGRTIEASFDNDLIYHSNILDANRASFSDEEWLKLNIEDDNLVVVRMPEDRFRYEQEYALRVRAVDIVSDSTPETIILEESEVLRQLSYLGESIFNLKLESVYSPLYEVTSLEVSLEDYANPVALRAEDFKVKNPAEPTVEMDLSSYGITSRENIDQIKISFEYGENKEKSEFSEIVYFTYVREEDFESEIDEIISGGGQSTYVDLIKPEKRYNSSFTEFIFRTNDSIVTNDVSIKLTASPFNDLPHITSPGEMDGVIYFIEDTDEYTDIKFEPSSTIPVNNELELLVGIRDETFRFTLITELDPFYTTVKSVINSGLRPFSKYIDEFDIMYAIYDNSERVQHIIEQDDETDYDFSEEIPYPVRMFVKTKTVLDCLYSLYFKQSGTSSFKLGDFSLESIEYESIAPLIERKKEELIEWEDEMASTGDFAKMLTFVKGEGSYELNPRTF